VTSDGVGGAAGAAGAGGEAGKAGEVGEVAVTTISSRELTHHVGASFSSPAAIAVTRELVLAFATLTGADHWMHVDAERAAASPLGRATVPGLLTLSLGARLEKQILHVQASDAVFYGFDRVRFPAPMFVGAPLRLEVEIISATSSPDSVRAVFRHRFWSSGAKPVCVAEQNVRYTHDQP
jgi:acyl dehydratase